MARSLWKGDNFDSSKIIKSGNYVWNRSKLIVKSDVGKVYNIHNGNSFTELYIEESMVGKKLGEYVITRRMGSMIHIKKEKGKRR